MDGGESFYRPLEERPLTIGRAPSCDIQLQSDGVLDRHASVTVVGDARGGTKTYRIRGESDSAVIKINGEPTREAQLALGDRIELGQAVLVLGQQVRRPATASDVLEQTASSSSESRIRPRKASVSSRLVVGAAVVAALGLAVFLSQWSPGASLQVPYTENDQIRRARTGGRFEEGRQILLKLREDWARQDPARRELIDELGRQFEATAKEFDRLRAEVRRGVLDQARIEQLAWLKDLKSAKHPDAVREAATIVAGRLTEFREQARPAALAALAAKRPAGATGKGAGGTGADPKGAQPLARPQWLDVRIADVRKLHAAGQHSRALEMLRQALPDVPVAYAAPLRDLLDEVRQATRAEMEQLVAQARELQRQGKLPDAIALLKAEVMRFPTIGPLAQVYHSLSGLEADLELGPVMLRRLAVAESATPRPTPRKERPNQPKERPNALEIEDPAVPRMRRIPARVPETDYSALFQGLLYQVQNAEQNGKLDAALAQAQAAASRLRERPRLAAALVNRAADLAVLVEMSKQAQSRIKPELGLQVTVSEGRVLPVSGMDGHLLVCGTREDTVKVGWFGLGADQAAKLLAAIDMPAEGLLGLAVLRYRSGDSEGAEQLLARLVLKDTSLKTQIDGIVSRGRNEHVDAEGYAVVSGEFIATRFLRVEKLAGKIGRRIGQLHKRDKQARDKVLAEILTGGDDANDAVALALRAQQRKLIENIKKSPFQKGYGKVAATRERLDKARAHALVLIFDHKKYFYPYRPPAVSGDRASEYWKVQKEVDKRVAAVKKIWLHDKTKSVVPQALWRGMDFLRWVNDSLSGLGEPVGAEMQQIAWVETLPPVKVLTANNFCKNMKEKRRFLLEMRIEMLNEILGEESMGEGEQSQVSITNSYRRMMGRNILAVNPKVHKAARGHAVEMGALGYFGHFSPNPERKTPFQRMSLEGYTFGVSENIAKTASAADAHRRWLHSSGHHRNILMPSHTEFAVGNVGPLWVQNFGMGDDYRSNEQFPPPQGQ